MVEKEFKFTIEEKVYFWIAINREYLSLCSMALPSTPKVSPRPELLLCFKTIQDAKLARKIFLTSASVEEAIEEMIRARLKMGAVVLSDPEPPTKGPMCWSFPGL